MSHLTSLILNMKALSHNLAQIKSMAPASKIIAMVKANAYGHGLKQTVKALENADAFGVVSMKEAEVIRQTGLKQPIVLMHGINHVNDFSKATELNLDLVIHQDWQIDDLYRTRFEKKLTVWLKINTGMNRLGFNIETIEKAYKKLCACPNVIKPLHAITHFSDLTHAPKQLALFQSILASLPKVRYQSAANSAAILQYPASHLDYIRPGILLHGISPIPNTRGKEFKLIPAMTLLSKLISINIAKKGEAVGYDRKWVCPENMPVGVVAIGYGDGYPYSAPSGTPTLIRDRLCPIIGNVSMDLITIDLRACPNAKIGDIVTLWGEELPIETIAHYVQTSPYSLPCQLTTRVTRRLLNK